MLSIRPVNGTVDQGVLPCDVSAVVARASLTKACRPEDQTSPTMLVQSQQLPHSRPRIRDTSSAANFQQAVETCGRRSGTATLHVLTLIDSSCSVRLQPEESGRHFQLSGACRFCRKLRSPRPPHYPAVRATTSTNGPALTVLSSSVQWNRRIVTGAPPSGYIDERRFAHSA